MPNTGSYPAVDVSHLHVDGHVSTAVDHGVATVRFEHPKGNSMPGALLRALADQIREAGARADVRIVVLRSGARGPFCAGASFDELVAISEAGDLDAGREFFSGFSRVILAMLRCPKFVVARVHGRVAGGGVGLVAAADYAVATQAASCRLSELAVGIGPFVVGPVIERKIGLAAFSAMAVDADWRDATWAHQHGLFARLVPGTAELDAEVDTLVRRLAGYNPEAMAEIKRVVWSGTEHWDPLLADRAGTSGRLVLSDFTRRAIAAFRNG
ncbi:enoyl-CoA hydratase [Gemmatimonadetes bacterium T265]|nr:enoyl-CoA hydratase [Gemmatimonadetes bacterium T265]